MLLESITLTDGRTFNGIVDFVTTKHIYFLDFSNNTDATLIQLASEWKLDESTDMRFSVWMLKHYPSYKLPTTRLIPTNNIVNKKYDPTVLKRGRRSRQILHADSID